MGKQTKGSASRRLMSVLVILAMLLQSLSLSAFAQDGDDALSEVDEVISGSAVETDSAADSTTDSAFAEEVDSIDTVEPEINFISASTQLTREEILDSLGIAKDFAVFAIDFINDADMEGAIAVKNLNGANANFGATDHVFTYAPAPIYDITIGKSVDGDEKVGTFRFGFFVENKQDGGFKLVENLGIHTITTDTSGKGSVTINSLSFDEGTTYYVFELDDNNNPIIEGGEGISGGKGYKVSYSLNSIDDFASRRENVKNTSYIENFKMWGDWGSEGTELLHPEADGLINGELVIGPTNEIDDSEPNVYIITGADGSRYRVNKRDIVRKEDPFPINFDEEMEKLAGASRTLADAVSNDSVKVVNIPVGAGEPQTDWQGNDVCYGWLELDKATCDGAPLLADQNEWSQSGKGVSTDGKFLVFNVDCSKLPEDIGDINIQGAYINGYNSANWHSIAKDVIWNFYTVKDGQYEPYKGTINVSSLLGTILLPYGTFKQTGANVNGSVIAKSIPTHAGGEIHHIPDAPEPEKIQQSIHVSNSYLPELTTEETSTESTTVTTTTETTTVTTTETTTEETTTVTTTETTTETTTVTTTTVATTTTEASTAALTTVTESTTEENTTPPGDDNKHTTTTEAVTETTTESTTVGPTTTSTTEATTEETSTESTTTAGPTTTSTTEATTETTTETTTEATTIETTSEVTTAELTTKPDSGHPHEHPSTTTEATTVAPTTEATTETTTAAPTTEATTEATTIAPTTEATTETPTETTTVAELTTKPDGGHPHEHPSTEATTEITTAAPTTVAPTTEATTEATTLAPTTEKASETTTVAELTTTKPDGGHPHEHPSTEATTEITTAAPTTVAPTTEAASETTTVAEMTTTKPSGGGGNPPDEPTPEESSVEDTTVTEVTSEATTASIESTTEITTSIEASSEATTNETPDITETPPDTPDTPDTPGTPGNPPGGRGPRTPDTPDTPGSPGSPDSPGGSTGFSFNRPRSSITAPDGSAVMSLRRPHSAITPPADAPTTTVTNVTRPKVAASLPKTGDPTANGIAVMLILLAGAVFMFTLKRPKK